MNLSEVKNLLFEYIEEHPEVNGKNPSEKALVEFDNFKDVVFKNNQYCFQFEANEKIEEVLSVILDYLSEHNKKLGDYRIEYNKNQLYVFLETK